MPKLLRLFTIAFLTCCSFTSLKAQTQLCGGDNFSIGLASNGTVYAWGSNTSGQIGQGTTSSAAYTTPVKVVFPQRANGLSFSQVNAGSGSHALAIDCNGNVWAWGENVCGQAGNGSIYSGTYAACISDSVSLPQPIPTKVVRGAQPAGTDSNAIYLHGIKSIGLGNNFSMAVDSAGYVWAWGENAVGELGNGTSGNVSATPTQVIKCTGGALTHIVMAKAGDDMAYALDDSGHVWAWGLNDNYNLGNGSETNSLNSACAAKVTKTPTPATSSFISNNPLSGIKKIAAGDTHGMALDSSGQVWTWGGNWAPGQLGQGIEYTANNFASRVVAPENFTNATGFAGTCSGCTFITNAMDIAGGQASSLILLSDGTVVSFGGQGFFPGVKCGEASSFFSGTLGNGLPSTGATCQSSSTICTSYTTSTPSGCTGFGTPLYVQKSAGHRLSNIVGISRGEAWYFAVDNTGAVWTWGFNGAGGNVIADNPGGTLGIGNSIDQPYAVQLTLPAAFGSVAVTCASKPNLGSDFYVCPASTFTLNAHANAPYYSYNWYSASSLNGPYTLITGQYSDSLPVTMGVSTAYYMVKVSSASVCGACAPVYDTIIVNPSLANYTGTGTVCGNNANFTAYGNSTNKYKWYNSFTGETVVGVGATINVSPSVTNQSYGNNCPYSLFVEDTSTYLGVLLPFGSAGSCATTSPGEISGKSGTYLEVIVNQTATLKSLQFVQSGAYGGGDAEFNFVIYSNNPGSAICGGCSPPADYDGPGTLLHSSTTTALTIAASASVVQTLTDNAPYVLNPGKYWIGLNSSGGTAAWLNYTCTPSYVAGTDTWATTYNDNTGYNVMKAVSAFMEGEVMGSGSVFNIQFTAGNPYTCGRLQVCAKNSLDMTLSSTSSSICIGDSVQLKANVTIGSGSYSYNWSSSSNTIDSITVKPGVTTTYKVTATDNLLNCSATDSFTVVVRQAPEAVVTASDSTICLGDSTELHVTLLENAPLYLSWSPVSSDQQTLTVSPTDTTTYKVTITEEFGCGVTVDSVTIYVSKPISVGIITSSDTICAGKLITLIASAKNGSGSYIYNWTPGADTAHSITANPSATTTYSVKVTDKQSDCKATDTTVIKVIPLPLLSIVQHSDTLLAVVSSGMPPYSYEWKGISGDTNTIIADTTGEYIVTVNDFSGCKVSSLPYYYIALAVTGISPQVLSGSLILYPNPANSEVTVHYTGSTQNNFTYTLINLDGKELLSGQGDSSISVASLAEGFYILKAQFASGDIIYKKMVIER